MSMQIKDMILSTLAEMENTPQLEDNKEIQEQQKSVKIVKKTIIPKEEQDSLEVKKEIVKDEVALERELKYLSALRERFLVLFEGFQSPNNANIEAKIDLTLNFLEYVLSTLDNSISLLEKGKK